MIAVFKPYPATKPSGVEWLGEIPAHWEVKRLKYVAPLSTERWQETMADLPYVGLEHVESASGKLASYAEAAPSGEDEPESEGTSSLFRPGDVLFGKLRPYLAKVLTPSFEGRCSTELLVLRSTSEVTPSILAYQLLSPGFISWINSMTYGIKMPRANAGQVTEAFVAVAPPEEQRAIAAFLDRETAKIDALVAKKERLIELLLEKRTALISNAVTKGLDPNVPMKDSGVEWLGEIPAHWEVLRLKYLSTVDDEALSEDADPDLEIVYVDIGNVDASAGIMAKERYSFSMAPSRARRVVRHGDVIVSTVRTYLRAIAPIINPEPNLIVSTGFAVVRPARLDFRFAAYALRAPYFVDRVVANSVGVSYPAINATELVCFPVASSGLDEQRAIAAFLGRETARIDMLVAKVDEGIERMKEYRTALISSAVTGRIRVSHDATEKNGSNTRAVTD